MADRAGYRWGIRVRYDHGRSQRWECRTEHDARLEYSQLLAECAAGEHPGVSGVLLERQAVAAWEAVESASLAGRAAGEPGGGGRMTKRDYLLVTALQRLWAAKDLAADARPHSAMPKLEMMWLRTVDQIDCMIAHLEEAVEEAMQSGEATDGR